MKCELGSDNGEVILSGFDENVEVEEKKKSEERDRERRVLIKEAEMEIHVVNEAIRARFKRGTRWNRKRTGIGIKLGGGNEGPSGCGFRRAIGSGEDEEDENRENGERERGRFEEGERECHAIPKTNQIKAFLCD